MRRRTHFIGLWLDDAEYEHLCEQCGISALTASAHVRKLIMGSQVLPRPPDELSKLLRQLYGMANNINQIAHHVNARKCATDTDLQELATLVREAYRLIKDTL
ncbi:MAG: MobC family plasmid mobilization relaxosome protein [Oscillospiraceae bacterium]